jgi:hypothetical protein
VDSESTALLYQATKFEYATGFKKPLLCLPSLLWRWHLSRCWYAVNAVSPLPKFIFCLHSSWKRKRTACSDNHLLSGRLQKFGPYFISPELVVRCHLRFRVMIDIHIEKTIRLTCIFKWHTTWHVRLRLWYPLGLERIADAWSLITAWLFDSVLCRFWYSRRIQVAFTLLQ